MVLTYVEIIYYVCVFVCVYAYICTYIYKTIVEKQTMNLKKRRKDKCRLGRRKGKK